MAPARTAPPAARSSPTAHGSLPARPSAALSSYGTEAVGVPGRGRGGSELHPRRAARAHQPVTACTVAPLFDALAAFHDDRPGVAVTLLEDNSGPLTQHVRSGALDIALIGAAGSPPPALAALPVISERLVAAAQKTHFLSERSRLTLTGLAGCPLICLPAGTGIRTVFDQAVSAAGVRLDVALEASAPAAVADLAARGLGVAIVSETIAAAHADRLHAAVLDDVVTPALLALIWRPSPSPAAAAFLTHCRRAFALP